MSPKAYDHPGETPAPAAFAAAPDPTYIAPVQVIQTAATVAGTTVWAMRNGATKIITYRRLRAVHAFTGVLAAGQLRYGLFRFSTATPTGGTAITVAEADTDNPATGVVSCRMLDTGLTVAGVVFEPTPLRIYALPLAATLGLALAGVVPIVQINDDISDIVLRANEGLALQIVGGAAIIGWSLIGEAEWSEGAI